jgi:hypothetical protein
MGFLVRHDLKGRRGRSNPAEEIRLEFENLGGRIEAI